MAYRKIDFANNNYYHIYNRGVDKRIIFESNSDFRRFLEYLQFFNTTKKVQLADIRKTNLEDSPQEKLVDILVYCLMPNHFHLLLKQRISGGISTFMKKIGTGYSMYFNISRNRTGSLFQGPYKAKAVANDNYLTHLSRYIHLNPIELVETSWKEKGIKNKNKSFPFIEKYPWSSYAIYLAGGNHKIVNRNILHELFSPDNYKEFVQNWATEKGLEDCPQDWFL